MDHIFIIKKGFEWITEYLNNGTVEHTFANGCDFTGENLTDSCKSKKKVDECALYCAEQLKCMTYLAIKYEDEYWCCLKHKVEGVKELTTENAKKYDDFTMYNSTCGIIKRLYPNVNKKTS